MNLELAIQKNTESIESLTFVIQQLITALAAAEPVETAPEKVAIAPEKVAIATEMAPDPIVITTVITPPAPVKNEISYSEVAKKITTVFQIDRMAVVNALAKFGAAKGPELKPEDYAAFMSELS